MSTPTIVTKSPLVVELEAGTHYWCSCGKSANQPFCDGSHKGTSFQPRSFKIEKKMRVAFCNCKHSENGHLCDGSHTKL